MVMAKTNVRINGEIVAVVESDASTVAMGSETGEAGTTDISRDILLRFTNGRREVGVEVKTVSKKSETSEKAASTSTSKGSSKGGSKGASKKGSK